MKRILLDTHTLIWLAAGVNVGPVALEFIKGAATVFVSNLSIFEMRIKHAKGKFPEAEDIINSIEAMGFTTLDLAERQTRGYKIFNPANKDPYDNGLVAIAVAESLVLVTTDTAILSLTEKGLITRDARD